MSDDVFTNDQGGKTASALEELVGEGKKFATPEDLAKGKKEADDFIETLKAEKQEVEEALAKLKEGSADTETIAELIAELRKANTPTGDAGDQNMSNEDFQEKVLSILKGEKDADIRQTNRSEGNALVLQKVKGDAEAAKAYVTEKAKQLGTTPERLGELSEESPAAFAKLMDLEPSASPASTSRLKSDVNIQALSQDQKVMVVDGHHTKSYFDAKKEELGHVKWINDTALQTEMSKAMSALGEKFNQ